MQSRIFSAVIVVGLTLSGFSAISHAQMNGVSRDVTGFEGRWAATGQSSSKLKCGYAVVKLGIHDDQVEGNLRLIVGRWLDGADGVYRFSGTIDENGNLRTKGNSVSLNGTITNGNAIRGSWVAAQSECSGTFEGSREF